MTTELMGEPPPRAEQRAAAAALDRPLLTTPHRLLSRELLEAERRRLSHQPGRGLAGLTLVVPIALLLAFGVQGAEGSTIVLGPLAVFSLAPIAMVAFWWDDWPGTKLRAGWSGWADTLFVAVVAVALTVVAQTLVGSLDLRGIFSPDPGAGHSPVFPITLPLGGAAFAAMLQLTFVCEGRPFRRLGPFAGGLAALAASWAIALVLFFSLVGFQPPVGSGLSPQSGPLTPAELGALLVTAGLWQSWLYVTWRGWPFSALESRTERIVAGNVVIVAGAIATYAVVGAAGLTPAQRIPLDASFIAAALVVGLLFEGWLPLEPSGAWGRAATLVATFAGAAALYAVLDAYADRLDWTTAEPSQWIAHAALNAIALSVLLHVAIGRRWPFALRND